MAELEMQSESPGEFSDAAWDHLVRGFVEADMKNAERTEENESGAKHCAAASSLLHLRADILAELIEHSPPGSSAISAPTNTPEPYIDVVRLKGEIEFNAKDIRKCARHFSARRSLYTEVITQLDANRLDPSAARELAVRCHREASQCRDWLHFRREWRKTGGKAAIWVLFTAYSRLMGHNDSELTDKLWDAGMRPKLKPGDTVELQRQRLYDSVRKRVSDARKRAPSVIDDV